MDRIRITDVAPRDGLQNEPGVVPTPDKVRLIEMLADSGIDEVEATSFVSPKWAPQLGDAEAVLAALRTFGARRSSEPSPSGGGLGEGYSLLPNTRQSRTPQSTNRARALRREMTRSEVALWSRLRGDQVQGLRFRRQHSIGPYVADFYCPAAHLVVEIDGRSHSGADSTKRDRKRDAWMASLGLRTLRFANDDVLNATDAVVKRIADELMRGRETRPSRSRSPLPSPPPEGEGVSHARPILSALVPNAQGFERALAFHSPDFPLKIAVFTAASETFNRKNTNASIAESIDRFRAFLPRAFDAGMQVRFYISCAVACPFEGPIAPAAVRRVADALLDLVPEDRRDFECVEIDLGDTIGAATPATTRALLDEFNDDRWRDLLVLHLHDTLGRAVECAREAIDWGVWSFDSSVAGLGGCPYASTPGKRAPGNVSTEALACLADELGLVTFTDPDALAAAAAFARQIVGAARASASAGATQEPAP